MLHFSAISPLAFSPHPELRPYRQLLRLFAVLVFVSFGPFQALAQLSNTCELFPLNAPTPRANSLYALRSSVGEHFAIVGANANTTGSVPGQAHIYEYTGGVWVFRQTLNAPGTVTADAYGNNVYIDDNTALVAAYNYTRPATGARNGIIYVYTRQGSQWVLTGSFVNPSATIASFGWSLAKSGTDVLVGCNYNGSQNFAAYVFRQPVVPTQPWTLVATLPPQPGNTGYDYGYSVAIEGDNLVVGSLDAFSRGRSAAYFYRRSALGVWSLAQVEAYPNNSRAGFSVALHGNFAAIGSDSNLGVRLYELTAAGWQLRQTLYNPDTPPLPGGRYGFTVAMNSTALLVSNPFDFRAGVGNGIVYRYARRNGLWQLQRRYLTPAPQGNDGLGGWVAADARTHNFILSAPGRISGGIVGAGQAFVHWEPAVLPAGPFCATASPVLLQATATGGTWSGPGITGPQTGQFAPAQVGPGTHRVAYSLTAGSCTYSDTVSITVTAPLRITRPALPALTCARDTAFTLAATVAGGIWSGVGITNPQTGTFRTSVAGPGRHVITYTASSGSPCGTRDTFSVVVRPVRARIQAGPRRFSCARDTSLALLATPSGGSWRGPGITNAVTGAFSSAVAGPGRHVLTYSLPSTGACAGRDTVSVVVQPVAVRVLTAPLTLCRLDSAITLRATPAGGVWRGRGITNAQQGRFLAPSPGRYVLRYELGNGACRVADSVTVTVNPVPTPVVSPAVVVLRCGQSGGVLSSSAVPPTGTRLVWQYAVAPGATWQTLTNGNGQPTYQPTQAGLYRLQVLQGGCAAFSAITEVRVESVQPMQVPNIFTPNGDGVNETFELRLQYPRTSRLQVFTRWGNEVFSTGTYGQFWTATGAADGLYYYLWRFSTDCEPAERVVKGWVEVVR